MFAGYFDDPETTLKATRNLWYHTGDLGYLDEDGELFFADRKSDLMRFAGRTISAADVERAALGHAAVRQAAATGVAVDAGGGETEVMLTVVLSPGATLSAGELARFMNDTAPTIWCPGTSTSSNRSRSRRPGRSRSARSVTRVSLSVHGTGSQPGSSCASDRSKRWQVKRCGSSTV